MATFRTNLMNKVRHFLSSDICYVAFGIYLETNVDTLFNQNRWISFISIAVTTFDRIKPFSANANEEMNYHIML